MMTLRRVRQNGEQRTTIVTLDDIRQAQQRLRGVAARTPLVAHEDDGRRLWFKPESFQPIGSFKLRGAYNKIASLAEDERRRGVITYSSGNHAQGVAYSARALGAKAVVVMPRKRASHQDRSHQSAGSGDRSRRADQRRTPGARRKN